MNALSIVAIFAVAFLTIEAKLNSCGDFKSLSSCCGPKPSYVQLPLSYSPTPYAPFPPTALLPSSTPQKPCAPTPQASYQTRDSPKKIYFQNLAYSTPFPSPYPAPCAPPPLSYPAPCSPLPISCPSLSTPQSSYLPQSLETASFDPSPLAIFNSIKSSASCGFAPQYDAPPPPLPSRKVQPLPSPKFIPVQLKPLPNYKAPSCGANALPPSSCQTGFGINPSLLSALNYGPSPYGSK